MGQREVIEADMAKVRAASLGEVIMFADFTQPQVHGSVRLIGRLGIYGGMTGHTIYSIDGTNIRSIVSCDNKTSLGVREAWGIQVAEITEGAGIPFTDFDGNRPGIELMCLFPTERAYVGAEGILGVLKQNGYQLFDSFIQQYIERYRKLSQ